MAAIEIQEPEGAGVRRDVRSGVIASLGSNLWWGFLPLFFYYLNSVNAAEVVAARTLCSLVIVGAIIFATGRRDEALAALRNRRTAMTLLASAVLLAANWLIYIVAVETGHVLEGSFGYFINPMVNVATGMVLLGERQSRGQTVALVLALVAIAIQAIGLGSFPVISVSLALTFGCYGYLRKTVKANATTGLFVETLLLAPLALGYLTYSIVTQGAGPLVDPRMVVLLLLTGPATAVPLLLFAYSVQRLRLTTIGMFQYISPSIQFVLAITFFGEHLNPIRLGSFVLVWVSLMIFSADSWRGREGAMAPGER
jgi:chloramphenicol-sensitive protein RarD